MRRRDERIEGESCSTEARRPLSASAIQARRRSGGTTERKIVRYRSGETNEEPECVERRGAIQRRPNKKYISRRFDSIRQKKILDT